MSIPRTANQAELIMFCNPALYGVWSPHIGRAWLVRNTFMLQTHVAVIFQAECTYIIMENPVLQTTMCQASFVHTRPYHPFDIELGSKMKLINCKMVAGLFFRLFDVLHICLA